MVEYSVETLENGGFERRVSSLKELFKDEIKTNAVNLKNLSSKAPKWISIERYKTKIVKLNYLNNEVKNLMNQIPEQEQAEVLYEAAKLKESYDGKLSDVEAIQYSRLGLDESDLFLKYEEKVDNQNILSLVYKAIDEGNDPLLKIPIPSNIIFANNDIIVNSEGENKVLTLGNLPKDIQINTLHGIERKYKGLLEKSLKYELKKNPSVSPESLFYNDKILKLYIKYYNVQHYGDIYLDYKSLSEEDKQNLRKDFNAELATLDFIVNDVDDNLLRKKEERKEFLRKENEKRLERWKKRNEAINNRKSNYKKNNNNEENNTDAESKNINIQDASGVKIAEDAGLGKQLTKQYNNNSEDKEELQSNEQVFSLSWSRFIETHNQLRSSINEKIMLNIYNKNSNTIKDLDDKAWNGLKKIFHDHPDELNKIYNQLLTFPAEITNTRNELNKNMKFGEIIKDEKKNNEAIGTVIDNVRNVFKNNSNSSKRLEGNLGDRGLKLKEHEPVKIEGDNLILSGDFDGADVIVRYNLKSGEIFMNSFLQHNNDNSMITIGNKSEANHKIGLLAPFDKILTDDKLLNSQISLLNDIIVDNSKKQSAINSIIVKFMKTFNVINDNQELKNIEVVKGSGSDLFNFLEILKNSDLNTLNQFQLFMEKIINSDCSGLEWGKNNINGSKKNFDEKYENKYINLVKNYTKSFSENPMMFKDILKFDAGSNIGFTKLVIENITDNVGEQNGKLSLSKMNEFIKGLETNNEKS